MRERSSLMVHESLAHDTVDMDDHTFSGVMFDLSANPTQLVPHFVTSLEFARAPCLMILSDALGVSRLEKGISQQNSSRSRFSFL
jgi:hypothetical protein